MAIRAREVAAMIEWFVREARVAEVCRGPGNGAMAAAAVQRRIEVPRILPGRLRAVVTGRTGTQYLVVVHRGYRRPYDGAVAVLTDVGGLHMRGSLARRVSAVVTAGAIVDDICVIERRRRPRNRRVAVVAVIAAADMCRMLAGRRYTIVTGSARTENLGVIDRKDRYPDVGRMAVLTNVAGLDVSWRLACGVGAVVTA